MGKHLSYFTILLFSIVLTSCKSSSAFFDVDYKPILYVGFENKLNVKVPDIQEVKVSSDYAVCRILEKNTIIIKPTEKGGVATVTVSYKNKKKSLKFIIQEIPHPILTFRKEYKKIVPKTKNEKTASSEY